MKTNKSYKLLAIIGKSGSGKDTVLKALLEKTPGCFNRIVRTTTRPKRDYEIQDKDYHFVTHEEFTKMVENQQLIEATIFNSWCYGTRMADLSEDKINVGIFDPHSLDIILGEDLDVKTIYLDVDGKTRLIRSLNREEEVDVDEVLRRYKSDELDFRWVLQDFSPEVLDNTKSLSEVVYNIQDIVDHWY